MYVLLKSYFSQKLKANVKKAKRLNAEYVLPITEQTL